MSIVGGIINMRSTEWKKKRKRKQTKENRGDYMATQLAPTPVIKGQQAMHVLAQLSKKPNKETEIGLNKILSMFEKSKK